MAYRFVRQRRGRYSVREMATLFGVSSNALCCWAKEGVSEQRREADAGLAELSAGYGRRVITGMAGERAREALRQDFGKRASLKKAARLMRERDLNAVNADNLFLPPLSGTGCRFAQTR
jgi:hypothetical protein